MWSRHNALNDSIGGGGYAILCRKSIKNLMQGDPDDMRSGDSIALGRYYTRLAFWLVGMGCDRLEIDRHCYHTRLPTTIFLK
jgi:hypothetical protein